MLMFLHDLFIHHITRLDNGDIKITFFKKKEDVKDWTEKDANLFQVIANPLAFGGDELNAIEMALSIIRKEMQKQ